MPRTLEADYLVVGAGATGMAFTDALVAGSEARVVIVDRRSAPGGHWRAAYPFVRLHQASQFYGVASTMLGGGDVQTQGPEAGLHQRADRDTICAYYDEVLARLVGSGRVELLAGSEHVGAGRVRSLATGETTEVTGVGGPTRLVDARYRSPVVPSESARRYAVADDARVVPVNALPDVADAPHVAVLGSGKTATDAIVHLLGRGVDPDAITWVRPREPWMLDRARIQPDPATYLAMVGDLMEAAARAVTLDRLFEDLEEAGIMLRIDRSRTPTMAKAPTLGRWELDLLRGVEHVVRLGHVRSAHRDRLELEGGTVALPPGAVVVDCAADGLPDRPPIPVWAPDRITPQPIRAGFPCFGAALVGHVEGSGRDDDEKNRLCAPTPFGNSLRQWARMNADGARGSGVFMAEPDIAAWVASNPLNPSRVAPSEAGRADVRAALDRVREHSPAGIARLDALAREEAVPP
ncbi:NAD(P)-binding protein [Oryzobacter telluris]|uniref:NAD(P)-binding protein n=1 Tax=Oryzobacter telluris TaxID=3149179 RepID=UPI00370D5640